MTPGAGAQKALTDDAPVIVDLTCSKKRVYPKVATHRLDIDPMAEPDMLWDGMIIPFPDLSVHELYYDPPHYIGHHGFDKRPEMSAWFASVNRKKYPHQHFLNCVGRFSSWKTRAEWERALQSLNGEAARVLKYKGVLHVKLSELGRPNKSVRRKDIELLTNFEVSEERTTRSKYGKNATYWLTMKRKESDLDA